MVYISALEATLVPHHDSGPFSATPTTDATEKKHQCEFSPINDSSSNSGKTSQSIDLWYIICTNRK